MAAPFTLKVLGGASIEGPTGPTSGRSAQRHRLALLALLAATPRRMSRDKLVALLWPERSPSRARHALSDSIYRINKALKQDVVVAEGDRELWLDTGALPTDLAAFRRALEEERWERAVEIYEGPFLDGFHLSGSAEFDRWMEQERRSLARLHAQALESLAEDRAKGGDRTGATAAWRRRAALDPYDSRVAAGLMEALAAEGNPAGALRHARRHAELLEREFGTEPDRELTALAERIRERAGSRSGEARDLPRPGTDDGSSDPGRASTAPDPAPSTSSPTADSTAGDEAGSGAAIAGRNRAPGESGSGLVVTPGGKSWTKVALVVVAALAVLLAGSWLPDAMRPFSDPASAELPEGREEGVALAAATDGRAHSIAVLPFEDLSPRGDQRWFADGIADEVTQALDRVPELHVTGRNSSFVFRDRPLDVRRIAERLDVRFIVDGTVRKGGDSVWISAALIDGETGFYRWSDTYATSPSPQRLRSIQSRIARNVATALSLRVDEKPGMRDQPGNDGSYEAYLEGRFHLRRFQSGGSSDPQELLESLELFQWVVEREPRWADGWAGLGEAHHWAAYGGFEPERHRIESKRALERAVLLDPNHARANASLGYILHRLDRDYEAARARFQRALDLDSEQYWHCGYSFFLLWAGRYEDAVEATRRAEAHDPLFWPLIRLRALGNRCAGRFEEAVRQAERVLSVAPRAATAWRDLSLALEGAGDTELALQRLAEAEAHRPYLDLLRVLLLARSGRGDEAEALLGRVDVDGIVDWASEAYPSRQLTAEPLHAAALVGLGRREAAIQILQRAMDRDPDTLLYDRCYPELRALEGDSRYRELLRRTGVPDR